MSSAPANSATIDLFKSVTIEDSNVDPWDWSYCSSLNSKVSYKLMSKEPLEYFDYK